MDQLHSSEESSLSADASSVWVCPHPGSAPAFTSSELDAIVEHVYRGGGYSSFHACGTDCQGLWAAEQGSSVGLLHRQLLTMRTRTTVLPSFRHMTNVALDSAPATRRLRAYGSPDKLISFVVPAKAPQSSECAPGCPQWAYGVAKGSDLAVSALPIPAPADGLQWYWQHTNGSLFWRRLQAGPEPSCNGHPMVPAGFQTFSGAQNDWCYATRVHEVGFLDGEDVPVPEPVEDYTGQAFDSVANGAADPDPSALRAEIEEQFASGDLDYLERWYRFRLSGGCDPDASFCERELADTFRPLLLFDNDEKWRPLDVDQFLGERLNFPDILGQDNFERHRICSAADECADISSAADLAGANPDSYIDIAGDDDDYPMAGCEGDPVPVVGEDGSGDCVSDRTAIYYRAVPAGNYLMLDYWWFFRRDGGYSGQGSHEGDWEGIVVAVDPQSASPSFDWVGFDAHGETWRYLRSVLRCDSGGDGSCGDDASQIGERVHAYVSSGKHASYPRDCDSDDGPLGVNVCGQTSATGSPVFPPEGGFDGGASWESNNNATALRALPNPDEGWLAYVGYWGATRAGASPFDADSPRGPAQGDEHARWAYPSTAATSCRWAQDQCSETQLQPSQGSSANQACSPWFGPQVAIGICESASLTQALERGSLEEKRSFEIRDRSHERQAGAGDGLAQLVGPPLRIDESVTISSSLQRADAVVVRFVRGDKVLRAIFDGLKLAPSAALTVRVVKTPAGVVTPTLQTGGVSRTPDNISFGERGMENQ